ncbi:hypothetical protein PCANC_17379 [Puccinia coronata f. sp. avenae]|uniref:CCHC-type domain-containing protein n=1 Tax=Puccinia coronata f. sp. avenae TaxID=200324 RepID=A0A2N5UZU6_9BASI|nr:hypothetical protein PCANC_17379 [Puccinia coronata f. sp. avenae]
MQAHLLSRRSTCVACKTRGLQPLKLEQDFCNILSGEHLDFSQSLPLTLPLAYGPPNPPNPTIHVSHASMDEDLNPGDTSLTRLPAKPTTLPPSSIFLNHLADILGNPHNRTPDGALHLDPASLSVIQKLMEIEASRLLQMEQMMAQMMKTQDQMLKEQSDMRAWRTAFEGAQTRAPVSAQNTQPSSYATAAGKLRPATLAAPTAIPPPKPVLKSLKPGKAIIHSDPAQSKIHNTESGFLVQCANDVLLKLDAKVSGERVSIRGAQVLRSGDVCFYSVNKAHQRWLMENKHVWSKEVHPHLAATPSTYSVIAHGVPKSFNPAVPTSISKLAIKNQFAEGDLIRIKWLANNSNSEKQAGSIVLTFINKDTASRCEQAGIFLNYGYHRTAKFNPRPPQCFKCLRMGHFGQWCRDLACCAKCGDLHITKDCPQGIGGVSTCVLCKDGVKMKIEGVNSIDHTPHTPSNPQSNPDPPFPLPLPPPNLTQQDNLTRLHAHPITKNAQPPQPQTPSSKSSNLTATSLWKPR